ncbi:MAG: radical SAM protein [Chloroflexota bacterium]
MSWDAKRKAREQLGRERNTVGKDWGGRLPIALVYPNCYYIGMSNLGMHAIYRLLNSESKLVCERVFWEGVGPVVSLESQRPPGDFAVLAFSVPYELDYFNIPSLLKASGLPLYAAERGEEHPLVIDGGAAVMANPMPLAPFFDCLAIGEAEVILPALIAVINRGLGRRRLLEALAEVPGLYVPLVRPQGPVVRQFAARLDENLASSVIITPDTELGDLYLIEVARGCAWNCRFCLATRVFCPVRYASLERLLAQAREGLKYRRRLGLVGAVVTAHPDIEPLVLELRKLGAGISLSSLRIKPLPETVLRAVLEGGAKTLAFAPEAGSERLRRLINKGISEDDIFRAVGLVAAHGIKQLKLYFMIGLPTETDADIEEIIRLARGVKEVLAAGSGGRLVLNVAPFVPKAGTPFQWQPMARLDVLGSRLGQLKAGLAPLGIKVKAESPAWSEVQAVLARGDQTLGPVLAGMEEATLAGFRRASAKCGVDSDHYAHQVWDINGKLPWAAVTSAAETAALRREVGQAETS